jgi:hypothetical protein
LSRIGVGGPLIIVALLGVLCTPPLAPGGEWRVLLLRMWRMTRSEVRLWWLPVLLRHARIRSDCGRLRLLGLQLC